MKVIFKLLSVLIITLSAVIIASLFGAAHNQISFTVSDEFFSAYLSGHTGVGYWGFTSPRTEAALIGVVGSWWVGLITGIIYSLIFLLLKEKIRYTHIFNAFVINIAATLAASCIGFLLGSFIPWNKSNVWMDFGINDPQKYVQATYMHEGGYIGTVIGFIAGMIYLFSFLKNIRS